jgi:cytoskeletal protein CcmA (bactofilin family)
MKGELTAGEDLIVNGTIIGSITNGSRRLSVTTFARVHGDVHSASADIAGTVEGDVSGGSDLLLRRTAQLNGSLSADSVVVEQGTNLRNAILSGRVTCAPKKAPG